MLAVHYKTTYSSKPIYTITNLSQDWMVYQKNICKKKKKTRNFGTSMVGINICAKLSMNYTTFDQIYLYTNSIRGHRCPISHIDALSMPFSMGDEKGIHIDARLQLSMPSGTPGVRELKFWENVHHPQHVTCHVSCVLCHISRVTSHMSCFFVFFTNRWSLLVEGLLSTGPTPSSFDTMQ